MRMQIRRLTRLTNAFSKKWENLWAALLLALRVVQLRARSQDAARHPGDGGWYHRSYLVDPRTSGGGVIEWKPLLERPPPATTAQPETAGPLYLARATMLPCEPNYSYCVLRSYPHPHNRQIQNHPPKKAKATSPTKKKNAVISRPRPMPVPRERPYQANSMLPMATPIPAIMMAKGKMAQTRTGG